MTTFKDSTGEKWSIRITVGAVDRILELTGVDLYDDETSKRLLTDYRLCCAAACAVLMPDITAKGMTAEAFRDRLDGDAAAALVDAFWESVINFTRPELRATRKRIIAKIKEATELQAEQERERLDSGVIDRAIRAELSNQNRTIKKALDKRFAEISGDSPDDSVLIPATEQSAN